MANKKKEQEPQIEDNKIKCPICGKWKSKTRKFYLSNKVEYEKFDNRCYYCSDCLTDMCFNKQNILDIDNFKIVLEKFLDKPFYMDLYKESIINDRKTLGYYISQLNIRNKGKNLTWMDGEINQENEDGESNKNIINNESEGLDSEELKELQKFWGKGYSSEQYETLQNFYNDFITGYECDSPAQVLNFKNAAKTQLMADEALAKSEIPAYNQLMKTLSTILGDSNVKPVQSTGAEANDQITFGVLIKKYENDRPIHEDLDDEMKLYIDTLMIGHLAKMEGLNNDLVEKYNKTLEEYTIDFEKIHSEEDE